MALRDLQYVECRGTPRELGRQYGEGAREAIRNNVEMWVGSRFKETPSYVGNARKIISAHAPPLLEEIEGMAEGADIPPTSALLMNHVNMFEPGSPPADCTVLALAASPRGPVLAKNNDIEPDGRIHILRKVVPDEGLPVIHAGNAGWLSGFDSMNAEGLATGHTSVGSKLDRTGPRLDIRLWTYYLARTCRTTAEYLRRLGEVQLTGRGINLGVNDASGHTCVVQAATPLLVRRNERDGFVYATNHFVSDEVRNPALLAGDAGCRTAWRYGYLRWVEVSSPPRTAEDIAALLKSHEPWGPCRHGGPHVSSTVWSMIALPAERKLLACAGAPCRSAYTEYRL